MEPCPTCDAPAPRDQRLFVTLLVGLPLVLLISVVVVVLLVPPVGVLDQLATGLAFIGGITSLVFLFGAALGLSVGAWRRRRGHTHACLVATTIAGASLPVELVRESLSR